MFAHSVALIARCRLQPAFEASPPFSPVSSADENDQPETIDPLMLWEETTFHREVAAIESAGGDVMSFYRTYHSLNVKKPKKEARAARFRGRRPNGPATFGVSAGSEHPANASPACSTKSIQKTAIFPLPLLQSSVLPSSPRVRLAAI